MCITIVADKPHVTIARPHFLTPQFSVAVTHNYILIAPHFTYSGGMEARVNLVCCNRLVTSPRTQVQALTSHVLQRMQEMHQWYSIQAILDEMHITDQTTEPF